MYHLSATVTENLLGLSVCIELLERRGRFTDRHVHTTYLDFHTGARHEAVISELVLHLDSVCRNLSEFIPHVVASVLDEN